MNSFLQESTEQPSELRIFHFSFQLLFLRLSENSRWKTITYVQHFLVLKLLLFCQNVFFFQASWNPQSSVYLIEFVFGKWKEYSGFIIVHLHFKQLLRSWLISLDLFYDFVFYLRLVSLANIIVNKPSSMYLLKNILIILLLKIC